MMKITDDDIELGVIKLEEYADLFTNADDTQLQPTIFK